MASASVGKCRATKSVRYKFRKSDFPFLKHTTARKPLDFNGNHSFSTKDSEPGAAKHFDDGPP